MGAGETNGRWSGVERPYVQDDVERIRGRFHIEHTLARLGAERLWQLLHAEDYVAALGALTGSAGRPDGEGRPRRRSTSPAGRWRPTRTSPATTYPDQSLYPANSAPALVKRINNALLRADQIDSRRGRRTAPTGSRRSSPTPRPASAVRSTPSS